MGTYSEENRDMDDSGCIQDPSSMDCYAGSAQLLDLSDDVLLYILQHLTPRDLKALGFTCPRLGILIRDRSLWHRVDSRNERCGRARLRWYLGHVVHEGTYQLHLSGLAHLSQGCNGRSNRTRKEVVAECEHRHSENSSSDNDNISITPAGAPGVRVDYSEEQGWSVRERRRETPGPPYPLFRQHARMHISAQLPRHPDRFSGAPSWPEDSDDEDTMPNPGGPGPNPGGPRPNSDGSGPNSDILEPNSDVPGPNSDVPGPNSSEPEANASEPGLPIKCPGPQFTVTQSLLKHMRTLCANLTELSLEYCNINCRTTTISQLPQKLRKLSLRGTNCYNLPMDKSYLFKIHDYLPLLEELDVSECGWLEPASLLPLSKQPLLRVLRASHCYGLGEFVAYASLATRYGFRELKVLDLRGSPLGDSEVSALGWIPTLEELYLCPAPRKAVELAAKKDHTHYKGDYLPAYTELEQWEIDEPEHFRFHPLFNDSDSSINSSIEDIEAQIEEIKRAQAEELQRSEGGEHCEDTVRNTCCHDEPAPSTSNQNEAPKRRTEHNGNADPHNEPGPSKRRKDNDSTEATNKNLAQGNVSAESKVTENRNIPNIGVLDDDGNFNIILTKEPLNVGSSRTRPRVVQERDRPNVKGSRARERPTAKDKDNSGDVNEDDDTANDCDDCDNDINMDDVEDREGENYSIKRKIDNGEASNDSNQPGPSKRNKDEDAKNKRLDGDRTKDDQNDNSQDSDDDDDDDNDSSKDRLERRVCQIAVNAFLPDRAVYLVPNPNPQPGEYPWCIQENGENSVQNDENSAQIGESSPQNDENSAQNGENSAQNGENSAQNCENSSQSQPSTSKNSSNSSQNEPSTSKNEANNSEKPVPGIPGMPFMRYAGSCTVDLHDQQPVVIQCSVRPQERQQQVQREPRHHVLYVNLGRSQHSNVLRLFQNAHRNDPRVLFGTSHIEGSSLISDSAVRRFGRADGEDIVVHIGPNGPYAGNRQDVGGRPNRSTLRILSVTGYRNITDRSLTHLVTAAPNLQRIDFSNTNVTDQGVENFKMLRPDCEVVYSKFENIDDEHDA